MMKIICSTTGSDGNFSMITDEQTTIAIDAGIKIEKANKLSKYSLPEISGLLITHAHSDHTAHLKQFMRLGIETYATKDTWRKSNISSHLEFYAKTIEKKKQIEIGTFLIKPFEVAHANTDGTPCKTFGFLIYSKASKEKMLWITDTFLIENVFPPCEYICIECNYIDVEDYSEELEYINQSVEKRRVQSHLSLSNCINFLEKQDLSKIKFIKLLHITKQQGKIKDIILSELQNKFKGVEFLIEK